MDKNMEDILDALDFIKERMATKADVAELRLELRAFRTETEGSFRSLRTDRAELRESERVTKEIDEIRAEVRAIQKHLGIERKIAA